MLSLLLLASFAAAPQQNLSVEDLTRSGQTGRITESVTYGSSFSSGWELDSNGRQRAMRYDDFGATELGALTPLGSSSGEAVDVTGRVVGWSEAVVQGIQTRLPFQYQDATGMVAIPMGQADEGWATDLSIFGIEVVGSMRMPSGLVQAWEYRPGASIQVEPLSTPVGWESEAFAAEGQYIGGLVRDPSGREFAAIWDFHRALSIVPTPGAGNARVTGFGFAGTKAMCGWYVDAQGNAQSFFGRANALQDPLTFLPTLGGDWCKAMATDGFEVVGSAANSQGQARAFSYRLSDAQMSDLNDRLPSGSTDVLTEVSSIEFGPVLAINGSVSGQDRGFRGHRVSLFVSPASAGQLASLQTASAPVDTLAAYVFGFSHGSTAVPGCPGLVADIDSARLIARGRVTAQGNHVATVQVPGSAAGISVLIQVLLPEVCMSTEVVPVTIF